MTQRAPNLLVASVAVVAFAVAPSPSCAQSGPGTQAEVTIVAATTTAANTNSPVADEVRVGAAGDPAHAEAHAGGPSPSSDGWAIAGAGFGQTTFYDGEQAKAPTAQKPGPKDTPKPEPAKPKPQPTTAGPKDPRPMFSVRGFLDLAYESYAAQESFDAVYGSHTGLMWGGGGQLAHRSGWFVQGRVWSYSATGERVYVYNNEAFPLGISTKITVMPFDVGGGWRFVSRPRTSTPPGKAAPPPPPATGKTAPPPQGKPATPPPAKPATPSPAAKRQRVIPYFGGGVGVVKITEKGNFDEAGDNVDESHTSYHVFGGAEFPLARWFGIGAEAGWRKVPGGLEGTGAANAFNEKNLDHLYIAFRVIVGK